jgi:hypothetical protein
MATLTFTIAVNGQAGSRIRRLAKAIEEAASVLPDNNSSGASVVLTLDNAPSTGFASAQISGGPHTSAVKVC